MGLNRAIAAGAVLAAVLTGCGHGRPAAPPDVTVHVGDQTVQLRPTQYCLGSTGQRYDTQPPIVEVSPDMPIALTVPGDVADRGWSVQVFDQKLEEKLGEVRVDQGTAVLDRINTSDVVPPAFYLVVVEDKGGACGGFSGAWPVGFIRAGGTLPTGGSPSPSTAPPPAG